MENVTFREVQLKQSEAEAEEKPIRDATIPPPPPIDIDQDKLIPPIQVYEAVKGKPYTVDYLKVGNYWDLVKESDKTDETFGGLKKKIGVIEGYITHHIKKYYLPDKIESHQQVLKMLDRVLDYSSISDPLIKINKIYSFIVSKNKTRALNSLRKALFTNSIDQMVDSEIKPSTLGQFMPRKD